MNKKTLIYIQTPPPRRPFLVVSAGAACALPGPQTNPLPHHHSPASPLYRRAKTRRMIERRTTPALPLLPQAPCSLLFLLSSLSLLVVLACAFGVGVLARLQVEGAVLALDDCGGGCLDGIVSESLKPAKHITSSSGPPASISHLNTSTNQPTNRPLPFPVLPWIATRGGAAQRRRS